MKRQKRKKNTTEYTIDKRIATAAAIVKLMKEIVELYNLF